MCWDSTMYRLKLLTSPEGNLPTPTPIPTFFYANKGCNSGDLTYKCGISVHAYFCFERIRKSKQLDSSYPAYAMYLNLTYPIFSILYIYFTRYFPFFIEFWQFIQQVKYLLTCQFQSSPQFSIFWTNLQVDNIITFPYPIFTPICSINSRKTG